MNIDICIPAFNEEKIIAESARRVADVLTKIPGARYRIVVADNGSTDRTAAEALRVAGVEVLSVSMRGKGVAVREAGRGSSADVFGFIDADLSADPEDIPRLLDVLAGGKSDIVIGSRLLDTSAVRRDWMRTLSSRCFNVLRRMILGISVQDTQCGLKLMNEKGRMVLAACEETGWFLDMEFLARAERMGLLVRETPISWQEYRFAGRGSKLNLFRDSLGAVRAMFRIRRRLASTKN
ncbi:hypothetical protein A2635_05500 [Candidatus Peribacteria bacterium RIFCSPHIGHO2_01_FULL_51_9]|nr:MAG: hypothetical protein A2635_05500 [Candidatus Peribacteria bacterium RIFCSPHIGHO2_01_FULL_51_9]